jgi:hypothetical protein
VGELCRILRYCRYLDDLSDGGPGRVVNMDPEAVDFLHFTPSQEIFDLGPIVEKIEVFTRRYDLDRERFAGYFFTGERDPGKIAEELGCSLREVELVRQLVERVQTLNSLQVDVGPGRLHGNPKVAPVAEIYQDSQGNPHLRILADDVYDVQYRFHGSQDEELSRAEQQMIQELKAVNQRKTVLVRLVTYLYKYQYRFFATGKQVHLLPLTQARVARELQEEEATVSRLIRDKTIRTPWGTYPLKWGFVRVGKVVEILLTIREVEELKLGLRTRPFTDKEIQGILRHEYGVDLSRRSITYHRNKVRGSSNYYTRRRQVEAS